MNYTPKYDFRPPTAPTGVYQDLKVTGPTSVFDRIQRLHGKYLANFKNPAEGVTSTAANRYSSFKNDASSSYAPFTTNLITDKAYNYQNNLQILGSNSSYGTAKFGASSDPLTTVPVTVTDAISDTYTAGNMYRAVNSMDDRESRSIPNIIKEPTGEGFQAPPVERYGSSYGNYGASFVRSDNREVVESGYISGTYIPLQVNNSVEAGLSLGYHPYDVGTENVRYTEVQE